VTTTRSDQGTEPRLLQRRIACCLLSGIAAVVALVLLYSTIAKMDRLVTCRLELKGGEKNTEPIFARLLVPRETAHA